MIKLLPSSIRSCLVVCNAVAATDFESFENESALTREGLDFLELIKAIDARKAYSEGLDSGVIISRLTAVSA